MKIRVNQERLLTYLLNLLRYKPFTNSIMTPAHYRYMALIDLRLRAELTMSALNLVCATESPQNEIEKSRFVK